MLISKNHYEVPFLSLVVFLLHFSNNYYFQHGAGQAAHQPDLLVLQVREREQTQKQEYEECYRETLKGKI